MTEHYNNLKNRAISGEANVDPDPLNSRPYIRNGVDPKDPRGGNAQAIIDAMVDMVNNGALGVTVDTELSDVVEYPEPARVDKVAFEEQILLYRKFLERNGVKPTDAQRQAERIETDFYTAGNPTQQIEVFDRLTGIGKT